MILVFCSVFVFLWGYLKLFSHRNRLKMILAVTIFSILFSFMVSFLTVSSFFADSRSQSAQLSRPFHLRGHGIMYFRIGDMSYEMYFADVELFRMVFGIEEIVDEGGRIVGFRIFPHGQFNVDYTSTLFYQLALIFTGLNLIGALLAAITYKPVTFIYKKTEKLAKRSITRIAQFKKRNRNNGLYRWLFLD